MGCDLAKVCRLLASGSSPQKYWTTGLFLMFSPIWKSGQAIVSYQSNQLKVILWHFTSVSFFCTFSDRVGPCCSVARTALTGDFEVILRIPIGLQTKSALAATVGSFLTADPGWSLPSNVVKNLEHIVRMADTKLVQLWGWLPVWLTVNIMLRLAALRSVWILQSLDAHNCSRGMSELRASCNSGLVSRGNCSTGNETYWRNEKHTSWSIEITG